MKEINEEKNNGKNNSLEVESIFQLIYQENIDELTSYILNNKIEIWNIKNEDNLTILHSSCILDNLYIIKNIIEQIKKRLGINSEDSLLSEEKEKNVKIFQDFINAKTKVDGLTALHFASFRGNIEIIKLLIDNYADINALSNNGLNMIHKAAQGNKASAIIYFNKKYNMDLEASENEKKLNALHLAIISGMEDSAIFLLNLGIDPNIQDDKGYTALHYAVKYNHPRLIKKLLQKGANINIQENKYKQTPVLMAKNKSEILEIFRKKGICEKLFFKPDIIKTKYSNINMIFFIIFHAIINILSFFILFPFFNNTLFSYSYIIISFIIFFLHFLLYLSNPGIMKNNEYTDLLDIVEKGEEVENFCPFCLVKNKYKSNHCLICEKCFEEFDHHFFWVGNCIGKKNYTLFFIFLVYTILNIIFNFCVTCFFFGKLITGKMDEEENNSFPKLYFGNDCFIYKKFMRIFLSFFIIIVCIVFFIPLIDLFKLQIYNAIEKRKNRIDEEEYERSRMTERLAEDSHTEKLTIYKDEWGDGAYRRESVKKKIREE